MQKRVAETQGHTHNDGEVLARFEESFYLIDEVLYPECRVGVLQAAGGLVLVESLHGALQDALHCGHL